MNSNIGKMPLRMVVIAALALSQGCATRNWVREYVDPVTGRVTQSETRLIQTDSQISGLGTRLTGAEGKLGQVEGKLGQVEGRIGQVEGRIGQVDAKTEKALTALSNLRLERRLVVDLKEGANFRNGSANLPPRARKEIDGFLGNLKGGDLSSENAVIVVAGHSDSTGSPNVNYELGKRRADAVSRYLVTQKQVDPLRVKTVSYGETMPVEDNKTRQGRAKNRRVEILVYRETITSAAVTLAGPPQ